jgi:hypothetical protein
MPSRQLKNVVFLPFGDETDASRPDVEATLSSA